MIQLNYHHAAHFTHMISFHAQYYRVPKFYVLVSCHRKKKGMFLYCINFRKYLLLQLMYTHTKGQLILYMQLQGPILFFRSVKFTVPLDQISTLHGLYLDIAVEQVAVAASGLT